MPSHNLHVQHGCLTMSLLRHAWPVYQVCLLVMRAWYGYAISCTWAASCGSCRFSTMTLFHIHSASCHHWWPCFLVLLRFLNFRCLLVSVGFERNTFGFSLGFLDKRIRLLMPVITEHHEDFAATKREMLSASEHLSQQPRRARAEWVVIRRQCQSGHWRPGGVPCVLAAPHCHAGGRAEGHDENVDHRHGPWYTICVYTIPWPATPVSFSSCQCSCQQLALLIKLSAMVTDYRGHRRTFFPARDYLPVHHEHCNYFEIIH